ncbi:hypothetical protein GGR58DRAFT_524035 [Xylaria digitata]|nr:hypothetical protein GGR58DRAFT_524035 [Xylaria digitata]
MSQSSQSESRAEPRGWLQYERALRKLLLSTKQRSLVSALYIYGPPTSELNTSLIDYVVQQAKDGLAPSRVIYITGTEIEMESAARRPSAALAMGFNKYESILTIKAAKRFCDEYEQGEAVMGNDLVLIIDVRMSATVAEEVMFGLVLNELQKSLRLKRGGAEVHIAVVLLGSSWFSKRTCHSFAKLMQVSGRPISETYPLIEPTFATEANLDRILGEALKKGQRMMFSQDASWNPFSIFRQIQNFRDKDGDELRTPVVPSKQDTIQDLKDVHLCQYVQVDPQSLFSAPSDLSIIVSGGYVLCDLFDPRISQVVQANRQLTRCEWDHVKAWAQMATTPVRFFINCRPEIIKQFKSGDEVLGPAWGKDLMSLVLRTIHMMGDNGNKVLSDFPIRVPANHVAWADRGRRLAVLKCLQVNSNKLGAYLLTENGRQMSYLTWTRNLDWEVAWLLMSASRKTELDHTSSYILVCMAAIVAHGPHSFVAKTGSLKDDESPYSLDDLREFCTPCLRHCAHYGMLWLYTGILLKQQNSNSSTSTLQLDAYIAACHTTGLEIRQLVADFLHLCGLSPNPPNQCLTGTPLNGRQVARINSALMMAFLHRIAYFGKEVRNPDPPVQDIVLAKDCVSLCDVRADQGEEFLDIEDRQAHAIETTQGGGFYAIYNQLERYDDEDDPYYAVKGLTWLPPTVIQSVEKETGMSWPEMVFRTQD